MIDSFVEQSEKLIQELTEEDGFVSATETTEGDDNVDRRTVDTSSPSQVRELKQNEVSLQLDFQKEVADDLLRFDFPKDYTMKLGCQFDIPAVRLYKDGET